MAQKIVTSGRIKEDTMFIKQFYTNCLSEAAYYVESGGQAAVIDPLRDTDQYVAFARERGARITYIFETHFHADFVSGHLELARQTGAPIVYGPGTRTRFPIHVARDGESFSIGEVTLEVIHTPGHTVESCCYLLKDEKGAPYCLFTGDTLFVGDVGRPDLSSGNLGSEELASMMFDSLARLSRLPDTVIVYPAHGPGSSCGKNLGPGTSTTIGEQKNSNYAMQATDREAFISLVTEGLQAPPRYFQTSARINREGYGNLEELMGRSDRALTVSGFKDLVSGGALVLDTREPEDFTRGFVPGALNIGLKGRFAEWAGMLLDYRQPVVLVTDPGLEQETIVRLARVGLETVRGYLKGGMEAWTAASEPRDMIIGVEPDELAMDMQFDKKLRILDVRHPAEYAAGHVQGAHNLPLEDMADPGALAALSEMQNLYVHCQSGYRSVIACSVIKRQGFHNLRNVEGGFDHMQTYPELTLVREKEVQD